MPPRVEQRADREVAERPVDAAGDERPDGDEQPVVVVVVEQATRGRGREHAGDADEEDDREHGLGAVAERLLAVVAQSDEDRPRPLQDEERPQPPVAHQLLSVTIWPL